MSHDKAANLHAEAIEMFNGGRRNTKEALKHHTANAYDTLYHAILDSASSPSWISRNRRFLQMINIRRSSAFQHQIQKKSVFLKPIETSLQLKSILLTASLKLRRTSFVRTPVS